MKNLRINKREKKTPTSRERGKNNLGGSIMKTNNDQKIKTVTDNELEEINGGYGYVIRTISFYKSGSTPKYKVGDIVEIAYEPFAHGHYKEWRRFKVTSVSSKKNAGLIFKEYTYTIERIGGTTKLHNVHESSLRSV